MNKHSKIICISCPVGCILTVCSGGDIEVTGHQCNAGIQYAKEEITNPTRNIATSVRVAGGAMPMLSVKTARPIPKGAIRAVVDAVHRVSVVAPVRIGDVVLADAAGTGVDVVATREVGRVNSLEGGRTHALHSNAQKHPCC